MLLRCACMLVVTLALLGCASPLVNKNTVPRFGVHETALASSREYANPLQDVSVTAEFTSPSGKVHPVDGFWDGQRLFRVRFSPDETGWWTYRIICSDAGNPGLQRSKGSFACIDAAADAHGLLRVSSGGSHFEHADGTPFYFLADTAWNGALRSSESDWNEYLSARQKQKFTAIQFVTTQWRGGDKVLDDRVFIGRQRIAVNPAAFQRIEQRLKAVIAHGMVPSPVMLWALTKDDPGQYLSEDDAIRLARYMKARWAAYHPVWMINGDGRYNENPERWKRIGRAVFGDSPTQLVTQHPSGQHWIADNFVDEPWYDFIGYQSGHGSSEGNLKWLTTGVVAQAWSKHKDHPRPIINLEPNYEGHPTYQDKTHHFTDRDVRRAAYWSQLVAPTAGVTYGNNPIWVWNPRDTADAENHKNLPNIPPWRAGVNMPGVASMTIMRDFFESGPWWKLRPAQELIVDNPGSKDVRRFIAAAASADWAVVYLPVGGDVALDVSRFKGPLKAQWFDPRTSSRRDAGPVPSGPARFTAPDEQDWILSLTRP